MLTEHCRRQFYIVRKHRFLGKGDLSEPKKASGPATDNFNCMFVCFLYTVYYDRWISVVCRRSRSCWGMVGRMSRRPTQRTADVVLTSAGAAAGRQRRASTRPSLRARRRWRSLAWRWRCPAGWRPGGKSSPATRRSWSRSSRARSSRSCSSSSTSSTGPGTSCETGSWWCD